MPRQLPGISSHLANAVRQVNAAFNRLPKSTQDLTEIRYDGLDRELDSACLSQDPDRALTAVRAWRDHWLDELGKAAR